MELVSPVLRTDFREFCVRYLVLREINDLFTMAEVSRGVLSPNPSFGGERRTLVEEYYASLDWENQKDADKLLKVLEYALAKSYPSDEPRNLLQNMYERNGLIVDGIHVYRKSGSQPSRQEVHVHPDILAGLERRFMELNKLDPVPRGFAFEKFLNDLFGAHELAPRGAFRLVGEQLDGSFKLYSDVYLLEAKWQMKPTSQQDLLVFQGKVESKARWARGLFISNSGFTADGLTAFSKGRATNIVGMTGQDLYFVLSGEVSLSEAIEMKARQAAESGEFFVPLFDIVRRSGV